MGPSHERSQLTRCALTRIVRPGRHEAAGAQNRLGVTLLMDLDAFYENIKHERLMEGGQGGCEEQGFVVVPLRVP